MYSTKLQCLSQATNATYIHLVFEKDFDAWFNALDVSTQNWAKTSQVREKKFLLLPKEDGSLAKVFALIKDAKDWMALGSLPFLLPEGVYQFEPLAETLIKYAALAWGLGAYQFTRYKKAKRLPAQLVCDDQEIKNILGAVYLIRDLINTPAEDMHPELLSAEAKALSKKYSAAFNEVSGEKLKAEFPCVYHVGKASVHKPRMVEFRWGNPADRKITLVGKGVCFDTGGLNIKADAGMLTMKKDMGGAAHVLGLAQLIMSQKLPIFLHVIIPAVENSISGEAMRPGDILTSRVGKTIEITNTDAEGRLILCDALAYAAEDKPELLIDFATLTGAARVAVGTDISAFFTNEDAWIAKVVENGLAVNDPCWPLPLYAPYRSMLESSIADMTNCATGGYAGASVAALFLQDFIPASQKWLHFDIMAMNLKAKPGKPEGGEAMGVRAVYEILKEML